MIVSFSKPEDALIWKEETKCNYTVISDEQRTLYSLFGLPRTVSKVWSLNIVHHYAGLKANNIKLVPMYEDDDPYQLGGDFVINKDGCVLLSHPSQTPTDRPAISSLLSAVSDISQ